MAFPTTSVLDNTTRADESPLSNAGGWANARIVNADYKLQLLTTTAVTQIQSVGAGGFGSQYWNTSFGPDCEVYASNVTATPFSTIERLYLRISNPDTASWSGYMASFLKNDAINLYVYTSGTPTLIGNSPTNWAGATAQIGVRAVGNVITCYIDGVESLNVIDNTYLGAGYIGCGTYGTGGAGLTAFGGGTYSVAAPATVAFDPHANLVYSTVATAPVTPTAGTYISLADATNFLDPATYGSYNISVWPADTRAVLSNTEIMRVTAKAGSTLTVTRATESTAARSVVVGDQVAMTITKKALTDVEAVLTPKFSRTVGATSVADGGTITHGLGTTPDVVLCTASTTGEFVSVTAKGATTFTVAIKKHDNTAGTTQTVNWMAIDIL